MGHLQRAVIGRPWATFDLLKSYHREALGEAAKQAFRYFNTQYTLSSIEEAGANSSLAELAKQLTSDAEAESLLCWSINVSPKSIRGQAKFRIEFLNDQDIPDVHAPPRISIGIEFDEGHRCGPGCTMSHPSRTISSYVDTPIISNRLVVPSRVLRGPWTHNNIKTLHWIVVNFELEHADGGNMLTFDREDATQGLVNAIRSYCAPVLALLVKPPSDCWWRSFVALYTTNGSVSTRRMGSLDVGDDEALFGLKVNTDLTVDDKYALFNVKIEDQHLVTALEAAMQRKDEDAKFFQWLLPLAVARQFDPENTAGSSPRNFVLIRWALEKEAEDKENGVLDGIGSLALRLLEEQQRGTMALFAGAAMDDDENEESGGG